MNAVDAHLGKHFDVARLARCLLAHRLLARHLLACCLLPGAIAYLDRVSHYVTLTQSATAYLDRVNQCLHD